ncbi:MAG TPA: hypothetical protein VLH40_00270 [Atribacteraceae bacterium]|nr:hypothetical protein [Atribacteraceae bacterium]
MGHTQDLTIALRSGGISDCHYWRAAQSITPINLVERLACVRAIQRCTIKRLTPELQATERHASPF